MDDDFGGGASSVFDWAPRWSVQTLDHQVKTGIIADEGIIADGRALLASNPMEPWDRRTPCRLVGPAATIGAQNLNYFVDVKVASL